MLNTTETKQLLEELGLRRLKVTQGRKGTNIQFCCPFHGERRPSAGILVSEGVGKCFSCHETFNLVKLVAQCNNISYADAKDFLQERFGVEFKSFNEEDGKKLRFKSWDDFEEHFIKKERTVFPITKIAPYRSGKETHDYIFDRGISWDSVERFKIGWDRTYKRVTIPVFHSDGKLAGVMGRAVLEMDDPSYKSIYKSSPKYDIYYNFPITEVLFGAHVFESEDSTAILVEGTLDLVWMHQLGFSNTLSTLIANFSEAQRNILYELKVNKVIFMFDNDQAGELASRDAYKILKDDFSVYKVEYPEGTKDPMDLNAQQIRMMIINKTPYTSKKILRLE